MKKRGFIGFALLFVLVAAVVAAGCIGGETTTQTTTTPPSSETSMATQTGVPEGGALVIGIRDEPDNLNPWKTTRATSDMIMQFVLDSLVAIDKNLKPVPLLAESWEVSENGTVYTFKLKKGIKFHDGTPFNADAVIFTFQKIKEGNQGWMIEMVKDMVKVDDYTVKFILEKPSITFLYNIADSGYFGIVSPTAYEKYKDKWGTEVLVGTGPFKFEKWIRGQEIVLVRNDDYHHGPEYAENKGPAHLEKIIFKIVPEATTLIGAVKTGDIDLVDSYYVPTEFVNELKSDPNLQFYMQPTYGTRFLAFNLKRKIFQDKRVRLAIAYAINKEAVANVAWNEAAYPTCSLLGATTLGYYEVSKDKCIPYDPEKAKQLLAEAGWKDTDGDGILEKDGQKFEISLLAYSISENRKSAVVIQQQLQEVGIKINLDVLEKGSAIAKAEEANYDIMEYGIWFTQGDGFLNFIAYSKNQGIGNIAFYANPKVDELLQKAATTSDLDEYYQYVKETQELLLDDLPYAPLVVLTDRMVAKNRVGGLEKVVEHPWWDTKLMALELYIKE